MYGLIMALQRRARQSGPYVMPWMRKEGEGDILRRRIYWQRQQQEEEQWGRRHLLPLAPQPPQSWVGGEVKKAEEGDP